MQKKKSSLLAWSIMILSLVALISGLGYYKYSQIREAIALGKSFPEHYEVVESAQATIADHVPSVTVLGYAASPQQADLFTELSGKVAYVGKASGEIAESNERLFQLNISEEQARIRSAKARERHAKSVFQRYEKLLKQRAISQEQYDQAYADLIVVQSEIEVLQATIAQKTVVAPFKGIMGFHNVKIGDYVSANQMLASFVGTTEIVWAEFSVPQFYPELTIGSKVQVRNIDAHRTAAFQPAIIIAKDTQISNTTRSLKYRAVIERESAQYTPNAPLEVVVPISGNKTVFQVPVTSVNHDLYGSYVMGLIPNESEEGTYRAARLPVEVAGEKGDQKLITHGVNENEIIATTGSFKLYEGLLVRIQEDKRNNVETLTQAVGEE
ncbi:efflux RND transporter periplasmic adaptor subunit [Vibrio diabolicus]|nr:efflux RND transporter periplasmic adaptor subunit [Vibrio diabolicus]